jgi:lysophospholipase L1-like esterase
MQQDKTAQPVTPLKIFSALLLLNLILAIVIFANPTGVIHLGKKWELNFVPLTKLFERDTAVVVDAMEVIADVKTVDTNLVSLDKKTLERLRKEKIDVPVDKRIQYPQQARQTLSAFFNSLADAESGKALIRIIHYGDSQLEGDRISDYLRNRMQLRFGGYGPGIVLPYDISNSRISVRQSESNNWVKYAIYGKTPKLNNGYYGIGASSYRYSGGAPVKADGDAKPEIVKRFVKKKVEDANGILSYEIDSNLYYYDTVRSKASIAGPTGAWFRILNATGSYPRVRQYQQLSLLYGADDAFNVKVKVNDGAEVNELLPATAAAVRTWDLGEVNTGVQINFYGRSPYLYGVALDGKTGVAVDNFPMRGSSALGFDGINNQMLSVLYRQMNAKLIILQYGINLVPDPKSNYDWYYKAFARQLNAIRKAAPDVSILVIGPSDMSRKTASGYESYPNVPLIRDAMKKAAFENNCAFWDLYTAMGGRNSMSSWVSNHLAAKDFTHFSTEGARYVSEMLYNTLMDEYLEYLKETGVL